MRRWIQWTRAAGAPFSLPGLVSDLGIVVAGVLALALVVVMGHIATGGGRHTGSVGSAPVSADHAGAAEPRPAPAAVPAAAAPAATPTSAPAKAPAATPPAAPRGAAAGATRAKAASPESEVQVGPGYELASADGGVFSFGNARYVGSMGATPLAAPVVAMAATPDGQGYWEAAADGGVFGFGDAHYAGGMAGRGLSAPIVGMAGTSDGGGYWLAAADGGVFAFGDAPYLGGMAGHSLGARIVGMAATPDGRGYWLVSSDGGIFTFGDAPYMGGMAGAGLAAPIVGMAPIPQGNGYWLVASDGGVFTYGYAPYYGGMGGDWLAAPMIGMASSPDGHGYWLASADGGVFTYGDAGFWGAPGGFALNQPVTAVVAGIHPAFRQPQVEVGGRYGYDISWPQCGHTSLPAAHAFAVLGVTGGKAFTANACLAEEWAWSTQAGGATSLYLNLNGADLGQAAESLTGPAGHCRPNDAACKAYNYGANSADWAVKYARSVGVGSPMWWLDVETENAWDSHTDVNALVVQGAIDELHRQHLQAGVYSTSYQWARITGDASFGVPVWVAGSSNLASSASYCSSGFNRGPVWMVQTMLDYDVNYLCRPTEAATAFGVHPLPTAPTWKAASR